MAETKDTLTKDAQAAPFASFSLLMDAHSELLQKEPDTNEKSSYLNEVQEFFDKARATGAVLENDDERRTAQSILNYWITVLYRANVGKPDDTNLAPYNPRLIVKMDDAECPYPGVRAFREDENKLFFGRQRQINYLLGRLREDRLLAIAGPSGSGKTSLVLAGLLPEMKRSDQANKIERYYFPVISPGSRPMENLQRLFQFSGDVAQEAGTQQTSNSRISSYQLVNKIEQFTKLPVVIVVDQFEEVFTRANDKDRRAFMANLGRIIQSPQARHIVILTMRDDDYDSYLPKPERFRKVLDPAKVSIPHLGSLDLREAIEKPAAYVGLKFDELTIESLVKEIISVPVGLPLLQFILVKLWGSFKQKEDVNEAFKQTGCARVILANSAEEFYKSLDFRERRLCRRLLTELIRLDSDLKAYSHPVARSELYRKTESNSRVDSLINNLASEQLLRINPGAVSADDEIELVHDSLIRNWSTMAGWVASKKKARRWGRIAAGVGLVALIFLAFLLGAMVWGEKKQGDQARNLARLSNKQFVYDRFDLAMLFGREAYNVESNATTRSNLLKLLYSLQSTSVPKMFLDKENFEAEDLVFSAEIDGPPRKLAAVDHVGNIVIWDLNSRLIEKTLVSDNLATFPLAFSPDGKRLATAALDPDVPLLLWDLESGQQTKLPQQPEAFPITSLVFTPDSRSLLTGSDAGSVIKWDIAGNEIKTTLLYEHRDTVRAIAFDATGHLLASASADGTVIVWDQRFKGGHRQTFAERGEFKGSQPDTGHKDFSSVAFRNKNDELAAGSGDEVFIWNMKTGKQVGKFNSAPMPTGTLVAFAEGGDLLTAFGFDGSLVLWKAHEAVGRQFYKPPATHSAAFSNNGRLLAFPSQNGVVVWDVFTERILPVGSTVNCLAFSPNLENRILASGSGDGSLVLWKTPNTEEHERIGSPVKEESGVSSLAFSEGGRLLAVGLQNGTISVRDPKDNSQISALDVQTAQLVRKVPLDSAPANEGAFSNWANQSSPPNVSKVIFDPRPGSSRLAALVVKSTKTDLSVSETEADLTTSVILWNTTEPTSKVVFANADSIVTSIAFSPDGQTLALGTASVGSSAANTKKNFAVVLWQEGEKQPSRLTCEEQVSSLAFSRDGILATGLESGKILLWYLATSRRTPAYSMEASTGRVTDLAFSPDGTTLAAVTNKQLRHSKPGVITLWDMETREPLGNPLVGHKGTISAIAFSADGKMLASGSEQDDSIAGSEVGPSIILWDLDVSGAGDRFCKIVECQHPRPEVADHVNARSWFHSLYRYVRSWF